MKSDPRQTSAAVAAAGAGVACLPLTLAFDPMVSMAVAVIVGVPAALLIYRWMMKRLGKQEGANDA